ncbi:YbjN domain-containing protein [Paenibacillus filicis]|uniref:YbjN domain-containing protein n=1 Tax=Paenibacillus filicis TaxID=669464 RepID=A0ABU9DI00_9BACL
MSVLIDEFKKYLHNDNWKYTELRNGTLLAAQPIRCDRGTYEGFFDLRNPQRIDFYFKVPIPIPEEKKEAISQFIHLANYGLSAVTFEFHWERGEVRSRSTLIWVEESAPSEETIRHHLVRNYLCLDEYFEGITAILYAGASPQEALEKSESTN